MKSTGTESRRGNTKERTEQEKKLVWPYAETISVRCADCANYRRSEHPRLGHCEVGEPESPAGLWDETFRYCKKWRAQNENKVGETG